MARLLYCGYAVPGEFGADFPEPCGATLPCPNKDHNQEEAPMQPKRSVLSLTQGELVEATVDDLHRFLYDASMEVSDLMAKLADSDTQLGRANVFAAEIAAKLDDAKTELKQAQDRIAVEKAAYVELERRMPKNLQVVHSGPNRGQVIDSSERPNHGEHPVETSRTTDGNHGHGW